MGAIVPGQEPVWINLAGAGADATLGTHNDGSTGGRVSHSRGGQGTEMHTEQSQHHVKRLGAR